MSVSDYINLVIAGAAIFGIFLSLLSNREVRLQRELQHLPMLRLSAQRSQEAMDLVQMVLEVKNIGNGIARNILCYTAVGKSDSVFKCVGLGRYELGMLSAGEGREELMEDSFHSIKADLNLDVDCYLHRLIIYEDIFRNIYFTNFHLKATKETFSLFRSHEPIKLTGINKILFTRQVAKVFGKLPS